MRCVAKDLGLSAQNRHEIGRILQEDGKYIYLYFIYLLICLNITLEVYNTDNYVENFASVCVFSRHENRAMAAAILLHHRRVDVICHI